MNYTLNREALRDQIRRIRVEEARTPQDHAFYALMALRADQIAAVFDRYNNLHKHNGKTIDGAAVLSVAIMESKQ